MWWCNQYGTDGLTQIYVHSTWDHIRIRRYASECVAHVHVCGCYLHTERHSLCTHTLFPPPCGPQLEKSLSFVTNWILWLHWLFEAQHTQLPLLLASIHYQSPTHCCKPGIHVCTHCTSEENIIYVCTCKACKIWTKDSDSMKRLRGQRKITEGEEETERSEEGVRW